MKKARNLKSQTVVCILSLVLLSACGQASPVIPTATLTTAPTESPTSTVTPIPTKTNTPEPTPTEATKQFSQCTAEKYRDCYIPPADLRAYADWTKERLQSLNLPEPNPSKVIAHKGGGKDIAFWYVKAGGGDISLIDRPFYPGYAFGYTEADIVRSDSTQYHAIYALSTVAFSIPGKPGEMVVVPVLMFEFSDFSGSKFVEWLNKWSNKGALRMAVMNSDHYIAKPIVNLNELAFPDLEAKVSEFEKTLDPTHIDGIIFETFFLR